MSDTRISVYTFADGKDSSLSLMQIDDKFQCFVLEDEYREVKVKGETRIPRGRYEVKFREEPSPATAKYRNRYTWFKWHLQLQKVPGFKYIYIHVGNTDDHTDGCLLIGESAHKTDKGEYTISKSVDAYKAFYELIQYRLKLGRVWIEITSIPFDK